MTATELIYQAYLNTPKPVRYNTRAPDPDNKGKMIDIVKEFAPKDKPLTVSACACAMCGVNGRPGIELAKTVSSNFTDFNLLGESPYICEACLFALNLYRYSFIAGETLRLLNVREMAAEIVRPQTPPFVAVISKTQHKHLFLRAVVNYNAENFTASLEDELISVNLERLRRQMLLIGSLQALGQSKTALAEDGVGFNIYKIFGRRVLEYYANEIKTRQMQIPLFLSQALGIGEEQAINNILEVMS